VSLAAFLGSSARFDPCETDWLLRLREYRCHLNLWHRRIKKVGASLIWLVELGFAEALLFSRFHHGGQPTTARKSSGRGTDADSRESGEPNGTRHCLMQSQQRIAEMRAVGALFRSIVGRSIMDISDLLSKGGGDD
jgi:hypothetical protein